ncbi:response regulator [Loktanella sp. F6476L]|uniref:response regulator n=1 Tax=Loktanella sp. F6476L TaxID=2926405 RepID=UPI001FF10056|nr:response regulator [Loktanella sp. F6476L]MCK0121028.1 response regulator [Loktanella sp. F6476L]
MSLRDALKVMVVDDMPTSRGLIVQSLEEMKIWNNTTENNGQSALERIGKQPVHLVLSDMNMPVMDGLELLAKLRSNRLTKGVGFILITGNPTAEIVAKGKALGMNNMIKKPFTTQQLKACIEQVVGRL